MASLLAKLKRIRLKADTYKALPEGAGVYIFFQGGIPIYIGKAVNLKRRVGSYFDLDLGVKTSKMIKNADFLSYIKAPSELTALLLEAKLIRTNMPRYNIAAKDDKHPLYIRITKERYPRVITARKTAEKEQNTAFYGPFPSSTNVRSVLRLLRHIFPYSDHKLGKRGCLYSHIGLCNPCPNEIEKLPENSEKSTARKRYLKSIRNLKAILDGKIDKVKKDLVKEMEAASKIEDYETAQKVRDQIKRLEYITQPQIPTEYFLANPNLYEDIRERELKDLGKILHLKSLRRIECFDVAHLAGVNPTASMVTFIRGEPEKTFYRHFKINQKQGQNDIASMAEVIGRRKKHFGDWGKPDLIIVDGGKAQVGVFIRELERQDLRVVGLAKRFETLVMPTKLDGTLKLKEYRLPKGYALNLVQRIRNEAHRFARRYHHELISRDLAQ